MTGFTPRQAIANITTTAAEQVAQRLEDQAARGRMDDPMFTLGQHVRVRNESGTYRVRAVEKDGSITIVGGPDRKWRTLPADRLREATLAERIEYETERGIR